MICYFGILCKSIATDRAVPIKKMGIHAHRHTHTHTSKSTIRTVANRFAVVNPLKRHYVHPLTLTTSSLTLILTPIIRVVRPVGVSSILCCEQCGKGWCYRRHIWAFPCTNSQNRP